MTDILEAHASLVARILDGEGWAPRSQPKAAYDNAGLKEPLDAFVDKIATHCSDITDGDFNGLRAAGLTEDQVFEIAVCSAVGQAARQYQRALRALEAAAQEDR